MRDAWRAGRVGAGLAVLHGWYVAPRSKVISEDHADPEEFRTIQRDLYVAPGDTGYWQGAIRDSDDPQHAEIAAAISEGRAVAVEVLYGDHEGGQRTISRFGVLPGEDEGAEWMATVLRHWQLEGLGPRDSP